MRWMSRCGILIQVMRSGELASKAELYGMCYRLGIVDAEPTAAMGFTAHLLIHDSSAPFKCEQ